MRVFVSHGHDETTRLLVTQFLEGRLQHAPVVLKEDIGGARAIVEKLEESSKDIDCALVLLTGDDATEAGGTRARQNVIHELGYFQGLLGRDRIVLVLEEGVESLSNIAGLEHISFPRGKVRSAFEDIRLALEKIAGLSPRPRVEALTWTLTSTDPTALVRLQRDPAGAITGAPVVIGANLTFLELFRYDPPLPSPEGDDALTTERLIAHLHEQGRLADADAIIEDQRRFFQTMFHPQPDARARLPLHITSGDRDGDRTVVLCLVGRGVMGSVARSPIASCLLTYLDEATLDAVRRLGLRSRLWVEGLRSENVVTVVLARKRGGQPEAPTVETASFEAAMFYGYSPYDKHRLKGKTLLDLLGLLAKYMSPEDYQDFAKDQEKVGKAYADTGRAWAKVPIRFNASHPYEAFRNKTFYPIISHSLVERHGEEEEDYIHVLYVNIENLGPALASPAVPPVPGAARRD
jgi:hypothetical protein